jgi:hypothetical protein
MVGQVRRPKVLSGDLAPENQIGSQVVIGRKLEEFEELHEGIYLLGPKKSVHAVFAPKALADCRLSLPNRSASVT